MPIRLLDFEWSLLAAPLAHEARLQFQLHLEYHLGQLCLQPDIPVSTSPLPPVANAGMASGRSDRAPARSPPPSCLHLSGRQRTETDSLVASLFLLDSPRSPASLHSIIWPLHLGCGVITLPVNLISDRVAKIFNASASKTLGLLQLST